MLQLNMESATVFVRVMKKLLHLVSLTKVKCSTLFKP